MAIHTTRNNPTTVMLMQKMITFHDRGHLDPAFFSNLFQLSSVTKPHLKLEVFSLYMSRPVLLLALTVCL